MCYAIPARIKGIEGDYATVDYGGVIKKVQITLIDDPSRGDYVLVHAGFAIQKLDTRSAEDSLRLIQNFIKESDGK